MMLLFRQWRLGFKNESEVLINKILFSVDCRG